MPSLDPETLKVPAFLRKKSLASKSKKKLLLTALDRKKAGLLRVPDSRKISGTPRKISYTEKRLVESAFAKRDWETFAPPLLEYSIPVKKPKTSKKKIAGKITHYYDKIQVTVIKLAIPLKLGDRLLLPSPYGDFEQTIDSMQINRKDVKRAGKGKEIGIKVIQPVKIGEKALLA